MGYPLKLPDGSTAIIEIKSGSVLTDEEKEALAEYVMFLRDQTDKKPEPPKK